METIKIEDTVGKKWFRFCGEGHIFSVKEVITDNDKMFCKECNKDVDQYEESCILAKNRKEAFELYEADERKLFIESLSQTIKSKKYDITNEKTLQAGIEDILNTQNISGYRREYKLTPVDIIDFFNDKQGIGIEVKIKGSPLQVSRQIHRYTESNEVKDIVLIATKPYTNIPDTLNNKRIFKIWLIQL